MKIKNHLVLAAAVILLCGCQTLKSPATLTAIARGATFSGTSLWLNAHPADREQFMLARASVKALIASGSGSPADLQKALAALPISQLSGPNGSMIVSDAVVIIDAAGAEIAAMDSKQVWSKYVLPVATGVSQGLDNALGLQARHR